MRNNKVATAAHLHINHSSHPSLQLFFKLQLVLGEQVSNSQVKLFSMNYFVFHQSNHHFQFPQYLLLQTSFFLVSTHQLFFQKSIDFLWLPLCGDPFPQAVSTVLNWQFLKSNFAHQILHIFDLSSILNSSLSQTQYLVFSLNDVRQIVIFEHCESITGL